MKAPEICQQQTSGVLLIRSRVQFQYPRDIRSCLALQSQVITDSVSNFASYFGGGGGKASEELCEKSHEKEPECCVKTLWGPHGYPLAIHFTCGYMFLNFM